MVRSGLKEADIFVPQTNGAISESIVQGWTLQALECYNIHCNCKLCSINKKYYSFVCQMPKVIKTLIKNNIQPDKSLVQINSF